MVAAFGLPCLASCSGSGGIDGTNFQTNPNASFQSSVAEPSAPAVAADWSSSAEYANSTGLAQVKAAEGYARRSGGLPGGQGVRIAIIDSGIDVTHPDLGNLAGTSWTAGGEALTSDAHATFVAGIAAASRTQSADPNDIHGIAYGATLVNFQASRPSQVQNNGGVTFATDDLVEAIRTASGLTEGSSAVASDILNLSLGALAGNDATFADLRTAMRAAADEGRIMVLAAGNEGQSGNAGDRLQPIYPAAYADDSGIAGFAIAVGNLTSTDQAASTSNFCGDVQDYCLFAPGSSIRSTLNGGGYGIGSGTSFAAPYVAGAAAVVKAAFLGVSSEDVVDRLLLTAEDLGAAGVDSTFGRGKLDLEAAMNPVGPTGFPIGPTVDGPIAPTELSTLRLGPGLALSADARRQLQGAMAVDSMGFPFPIDLGDAVDTTERDHGLSAFIGDDERAMAAAGNRHAEIAAFVPEGEIEGDSAHVAATSFNDPSTSDRPMPLHFQADVVEGAHVFASINAGSDGQLSLEKGLVERRATWLQASDYLSHGGRSASAHAGAGVSFSPSEGTAVAVSAFTSTDSGEGPESSLQRIEMKQSVIGDIELRLGLDLVQEEDGFFGGRSEGAFGEGTSSRSQVMTLALLAPLTEDIDWFGSWSRGRGAIGAAEGGLLRDWSDSRSQAFGTGLLIRDVARDDDGLTLTIGQPLRQEKVEATIDLPVARTPDGSVVTERRRLDFSPDAREIATEIGYRLPLGDDQRHEVQAAGFLRVNPGHDRERDPEAGFGLAYRLRF